MKIYIAHPSDIDYVNVLYRPIRASMLNSQHEFFLPHEDGAEVSTRERMKGFDLMICDVSNPSTGAGIEMGWANMLNIPIWCIHKEETRPSSAIKFVAQKVVNYKDAEDLVTKLQQAL